MADDKPNTKTPTTKEEDKSNTNEATSDHHTDNKWVDYFKDKDRYIQTAKVTLACLLAYILSVYPFPRVIPPSVRYMIGVITASVSLSTPSVLCVIGLFSVLFPFLFILGYAGATLILCGILVSKGLMVFLFVMVAFWFSGLRFESGLVNVGASILILFANMLSLSFYPLIQQANEAGQGLDAISALWTSSGLTNKMAILQNLLIASCWGIICLCVIPLCPPYRTSRSVLSQMIAPKALMGLSQFLKAIQQMLSTLANLSSPASSNDATTALEVQAGHEGEDKRENDDHEKDATAEQKQKQLQQKEAMFHAGAQGLVHVAAMMEGGSSAAMSVYEPRLWRPLEILWVPLQDLLQTMYLLITIVLALGTTIKQKLVQTLSANNDNNDDPEKGMSSKKKCHMYTIGSQIIEECVTALEQCAKNLSSNKLEDPIHFTSLEARTTTANKTEKIKNVDDSNNGNKEEDDSIDKTILMEQVLMELEPLLLLVETLVSKVNDWDTLMNGPYQYPSSFQDFLSKLWINVTSWFGVPYLTLKRLFYGELVDTMFNPHAYKNLINHGIYHHTTGDDFHNPPGVTFAWYLKYTIGVSILYILQVYYPATHKFAIPVLTTDSHTVSFVGWIIIAYLCSTQSTLQGTLKIGIARFGGTMLGAFSAWAAIQACGVYPNTNQIGVIVWLTVVTFVVALLTIQPGFTSMLGSRPDVGSLGMYLLSTQALIALEAVNGVHDINDLTLNRMVSQLVGIVMAMIMAILPPTVNGGHPEFTKNMILAQRDALSYLIQSVLVVQPSSEKDDTVADPSSSSSEMVGGKTPNTLKECQEQFQLCMDRSSYWKGLSTMLYKDSTKLFPKTFPTLSADPKLIKTIETTVVTSGGLQSLYLHTEWLRQRGELGSGDNSSISTKELFQPVEAELRSILERHESRKHSSHNQDSSIHDNDNTKQQQEGAVSTASKKSSLDVVNDNVDDRVKAFLYYASGLDESLTRREEELSQVNYTYFGTTATTKK